MRYIGIVFFLLVSILGSSCISRKFYGAYFFGNGDVSYLLHIYQDTSYDFNWRSGLKSGNCYGKWRKYSRSIFLQSDQDNQDLISVDFTSPVGNNRNIRLLDLNNIPIILGDLLINDTISLVTGIDGEAIIDDYLLIKKISMHYMGKSKVWKGDAPNEMSIIIKGNFSSDFECFFDEAQLILKSNKLLMKDIDGRLSKVILHKISESNKGDQ